MAVKFYTVETTINGTKYVAQFNGMSSILKMTDSCYIDGTGTQSMEKLSKYIFTNVIVEPSGLTVDDFDSFEDLNEVVDFARNVMQGHLKPKDEGATDKKSSK